MTHNQNESRKSVYATIVCVIIASLRFHATAPGANSFQKSIRPILENHCLDCHGMPDEGPEGELSLAKYDSRDSVLAARSTWNKVLHAVEAHEMPPAEAEDLSDVERQRFLHWIRHVLASVETDGYRNPGRPVPRRLTRLEYNNTVRDLLGLDIDVFMLAERLPFDKSYFQPESGQMPARLRMRAREYGAKYPALLPGGGLPGDSRAQHGFSNRGDTQSLSDAQLEGYVRLSENIMGHPEILQRARRLQEIFPEADYREPTPRGKSRPLVSAVADFAPHDNIAKDAEGNAFSLNAFRTRLERAFAEDRGGVYDVSENRNSVVPGKGGVIQIGYGSHTSRFIELNPNEDIWHAAFATAEESSGDSLFTNKTQGKKRFFFGIKPIAGRPGSGVRELGIVVLSRRGQQGTVRLTAEYENGAHHTRTVELMAGAGVDNTFVSFKAPEDQTINQLQIDGSQFSGDYVLLDDLAFITQDPPAKKPVLVGIEPPEEYDKSATSSRPGPQLDLSIANLSAKARLAHFMRRAFRRPVEEEEVDLYFTLHESAVASGKQPAEAMKTALAGVLASPSFLFILERGDASPVFLGERARGRETCEDSGDARRIISREFRNNSGQYDDEKPKAHTSRRTSNVLPLADHELATRLSYFLWSSMPDDELMELADAGRLSDPDVIGAQVDRMLAERNVRELSENFYVEWLRLRELWSAQPDRKLYSAYYAGPKGKNTLADDMFGEALLLFETILVENRPVLELLEADYTYVNPALAKRVYGFDELESLYLADQRPMRVGPLTENELKSDAEWFRIELPNESRGGVLTMAATLTLNSFPHRTSPIRRGAWFLESVFNRPPPPPEVAVADIDETESVEHLTLREKVELHRADRACAVCHNRIDPPGFALENFDAIGRWRNKDGGELLDASGSLRGLGSFDGPAEFKQRLAAEKTRFVRGFVEHLLSYALARRLEHYDEPTVDQIVRAAAVDDFRIRRIIVEIAKSHPFRNIHRHQEQHDR